MKQELINDIIEWDVVNWSKALDFWSKNLDIANQNHTCLELGGRRGGLALWLAVNNNKVTCSDLESPEETASILHNKYGCEDKIVYQAIDATQIPYEGHYDIVAFKSILGGISSNGNDVLQKTTIDEIHKCLKPNGKLLFAENLKSSILHDFLRRKFIKWGAGWNYLNYNNIDHVFSSFRSVQYITVGFFGAFGRTERQRSVLGHIDNVLKAFIPKQHRYIVIGIAEK